MAEQMNACIDENAALYNCAAGLSWECTEDGPMPTTQGCVDESMALVACMQTAPCQGHCEAAIEAGCGGASMDDCLTACATELEQMYRCDWELEDVYECHGSYGVRCENGEPISTDDCEEEFMDFADCVAWDDPCLGHCLVAEMAGCGGVSRDACVSDCEAERNPACEWEYDNLMECHAREGVDCVSGEPVSNGGCSWEQEEYDSCVNP
jgi:hypothetical protein